MRIIYIELLCIFLIANGCRKTSDLINDPVLIRYDFNKDKVDDFLIEYVSFTLDGIKPGEGMEGRIEVLNKNSILRKQNDNTLFIKLNDTIKAEVDYPLRWQSFIGTSLVFISRFFMEEWPPEWNIQCSQKQEFYYLGVRMNDKARILTGWLKFKIDAYSGMIKIIDNQFTTGKYIVIDR